VRTIEAPAMTRQIVCVTHPRRPLSTACALFLDVLRTHIRGLPGGAPRAGDTDR